MWFVAISKMTFSKVPNFATFFPYWSAIKKKSRNFTFLEPAFSYQKKKKKKLLPKTVCNFLLFQKWDFLKCQKSWFFILDCARRGGDMMAGNLYFKKCHFFRDPSEITMHLRTENENFDFGHKILCSICDPSLFYIWITHIQVVFFHDVLDSAR